MSDPSQPDPTATVDAANPLETAEPEEPIDPAAEIARLREENRALGRGIHLLHRVANLFRTTVELEPTFYALLTGVTAGVGLGLNRAMLFLVDEDGRGTLKGAAAVGPSDAEEAARIWTAIQAEGADLERLHEDGLDQRAHPGTLDRLVRSMTVESRGDSPVGLALARGAIVAADGTDDLGGLLHLPTAVAAPLRGRRAIGGVLYADNRFTGRLLDPVQRLVFGLMAEHAGRAIENARHVERLAREARIDALTGLGHHGTLRVDLDGAARAAHESGRPLGLLMLDIDDFKRVNDTHGHQAGDGLLTEFAGRLAALAREGEAPYRYGGEEFVLVLGGTGREGSEAAGERVRRMIADAPFDLGGGLSLPITCSVGVAVLPDDAADPASLIAAADAAMIHAKRTGKNRVVSFHPGLADGSGLIGDPIRPSRA
jgi:diguanylate cyclase (GGDEF)-like protein